MGNPQNAGILVILVGSEPIRRIYGLVSTRRQAIIWTVQIMACRLVGAWKYGLENGVKHIEGSTKWPTFAGNIFKSIFCEWKLLNFHSNLMGLGLFGCNW